MRVAVLGSGSKGNSYVIRDGDSIILVDAGFSFRALRKRLDAAGFSFDEVTAIFITHEHIDHVRALEQIGKHAPRPTYASPGTCRALEGKFFPLPPLVPIDGVIEVGSLRVEAFSIPHDAVDPVGYVITGGEGKRIAIATDMGVMTGSIKVALSQLDLLILESNHDEIMLNEGPYPWDVKQRIRSRHGHLSNNQVLEALPDLLSDRLKVLCLAHVSETNNSYGMVSRGVKKLLTAEGANHVKMEVANQNDILPPWEV